MSKDTPIMCPSSTCEPGNRLLGIVADDGRVRLLEEPITIDRTFVAIAHRGRIPEKRFRFTSPCREKACKQWKSGRCGVGDEIISVLGEDNPDQNALPKCGLRATCRWHKQSGATACAVCLQVITDTNT